MITEHGKWPAYISTGSRGWEKAPRWFIEYKATICHIAALSYKVVVPNYRDIAEMNNKGVVKRRYIYRERETILKVVMECVWYLAHQGIPLRGKDDGNDNLTQLLLLGGKGDPYVT